MADQQRNVAVGFGLAKIDSNLDQEIDGQRRMMEEVIREHEPRLTFLDQKSKRRILYTADKLRQHLMGLLKGGHNSVTGARKGGDIFKYGSRVLTDECLQRIGYTRAAPANAASSQDGDPDAMEDVQQESSTVPDTVQGQDATGSNNFTSRSPSAGRPEPPQSNKPGKRKLNETVANEGNAEVPAFKKARANPMSCPQDFDMANGQPAEEAQTKGTSESFVEKVQRKRTSQALVEEKAPSKDTTEANVQEKTQPSPGVKRSIDETEQEPEVSAHKRQRVEDEAPENHQDQSSVDVPRQDMVAQALPDNAKVDQAKDGSSEIRSLDQAVPAIESLQQSNNVIAPSAPSPDAESLTNDGRAVREREAITAATNAQDPAREDAGQPVLPEVRGVAQQDQQNEELRTKYDELKTKKEGAQPNREAENLKKQHEELKRKYEELESEKEGAQPRQEDENLKGQNEELKTRCDELSSQNEQLHVERDEWKCKYEDLLKMTTARKPDVFGSAKASITAHAADNVKSWTEMEPDEGKRRTESGLPRLIEDMETFLMKPVDADVPWPRPNTEVKDLFNIVHYSSSSIMKRMDSLNYSLKQTANYFSAECAAFGKTKSSIVSRPGAGLERIYETCFGSDDKDWRVEALNAQRFPQRGYEFLGGLLGAAVHDMVFTQPLPWDSASEWFEKLRSVAPYWNAAIIRKGCLHVQMDEIVWHGLLTQLDSATFQNRVVMPAAKILADQLQLALYPQLQQLGVTGGDEIPDTEFWNQVCANMTEMFMDALTLKGFLDVSPLEYEFSWITAGQDFNGDEMEPPMGIRPGEQRVVGKATTPVLRGVCPDVHGFNQWHMICKAKGVVFRPLKPA